MSVEKKGLMSDYAAWDSINPNPPSIADALTKANLGGETTVVKGINIDNDKGDNITAAIAAVSAADATVMVLGITKGGPLNSVTIALISIY